MVSKLMNFRNSWNLSPETKKWRITSRYLRRLGNRIPSARLPEAKFIMPVNLLKRCCAVALAAKPELW